MISLPSRNTATRIDKAAAEVMAAPSPSIDFAKIKTASEGAMPHVNEDIKNRITPMINNFL